MMANEVPILNEDLSDIDCDLTYERFCFYLGKIILF